MLVGTSCPGGAALHVVVDAAEAHTTNCTWYGKAMCTFEGISYVRWNMASVAGCTLGPMRTVAAMRNEPWLLPITNVPDSKIHAVMLRALPGQPRRVAIVDGVGKTGSDEWKLVGVKMVVSERSGGVADKSLPLVSLPATTILDVPVKPLPWEQVTHLAILIAHNVLGDDGVEPAE